MDITSYILSKRYVDETVVGAGALKGASCQIESIKETEEGNIITFVWEYTDGTKGTASITVKNGEEGTDGATPEIGSNGNWWIGGVDTGVVAAPDMAGYFNEDNLVALTNEEIDQLCVEEA
jgi:hypothetical protein